MLLTAALVALDTAGISGGDHCKCAAVRCSQAVPRNVTARTIDGVAASRSSRLSSADRGRPSYDDTVSAPLHIIVSD